MNKKGFTSLELLVVMVIIGVITAALVLRIGDVGRRASDTARMLDIRAIATALIHYRIDHDTYPVGTNASQLTMLVGPDYGLGGIIPRDPNTKEPYSYKTLEDNSHFIVCAKMSYGSTVGNTDKDYAKTINKGDDEDESYVSTYDGTLKKMANGGKYYCYAG